MSRRSHSRALSLTGFIADIRAANLDTMRNTELYNLYTRVVAFAETNKDHPKYDADATRICNEAREAYYAEMKHKGAGNEGMDFAAMGAQLQWKQRLESGTANDKDDFTDEIRACLIAALTVVKTAYSA